MLPSPAAHAATLPRVGIPSLPELRSPARLALPLAIGGAVLLWSTAFVAIRAALPEIGFASLASGRLLLAALSFAALARPLKVRTPARRELPALALLGLTGYAGYQLLLSAGERTVPAGTSALVFAAAPVLAAALARPLLRERLTRRGLAGLAIALAGAAITSLSQTTQAGPGVALVGAAVTLYALWVVLQKRALRRLRPVDVTAWSTWFGAAFSLPFATQLPHALATAPAGALGSLLLLGIVITTVPFLLWTYALSRLGAATAAPFLLLIGPSALLIGWIWLGEVPAAAALAGGAVTMAGVAATLPRRAA